MSLALVRSMMTLQRGWQPLHHWKLAEGRRLLDGAGFDASDHVPLSAWLVANPGSLVASVDAICRYVDDDLPDLEGMDELQAARDQHLEGSIR